MPRRVDSLFGLVHRLNDRDTIRAITASVPAILVGIVHPVNEGAHVDVLRGPCSSHSFAS